MQLIPPRTAAVSIDPARSLLAPQHEFVHVYEPEPAWLQEDSSAPQNGAAAEAPAITSVVREKLNTAPTNLVASAAGVGMIAPTPVRERAALLADRIAPEPAAAAKAEGSAAHSGGALASEAGEPKPALSKESVGHVIAQHVGELRRCYASEQGSHPELSGRVSIKFVIGAGGVVETAFTANSKPFNAQVERCVVQALQRWRFPAPEPGSFVLGTYRFALAHTGQ